MTKAEVRRRAAALGLRTAAKPDSQDVCFIHSESGRRQFLADRMALHPASSWTATARRLGEVAAVELVTIGQRKGLGVGGVAARSYAVEVDVPRRRVVVGAVDKLRTNRLQIGPATWVADPLPIGRRALVQSSAHGRVFEAEYRGDSLITPEPQRAVASGQTVALYDPGEPDTVVGSALAA